jgi:hypothetical protein
MKCSWSSTTLWTDTTETVDRANTFAVRIV